MNVSLILRVWHKKLDSFSRENLRIKISLHGVARPEQGEPFQISRFGCHTCCFHNTDQRNRRLGRNFIENDMRRVRRNQAEGCTSLREFADFLEQILSHTGEITCIHEIESLLQVNAVNDELGVTPIARSLAVKRDDPFVIIDRAFRAEAANDSKSLHMLTIRLRARLRRDKRIRLAKATA